MSLYILDLRAIGNKYSVGFNFRVSEFHGTQTEIPRLTNERIILFFTLQSTTITVLFPLPYLIGSLTLTSADKFRIRIIKITLWNNSLKAIAPVGYFTG